MRSTVYLVHDEETGEVVHLHVEDADLDSSPEEIVQLADPRGTRRLTATKLPPHADLSRPVRMVDGRPTPHDVPNWGHATVDGGPVAPDVPRRYVPE
jgi:hypothetical protein